MFNESDFCKKQFIDNKIVYKYCNDSDVVMHIAYNINNDFFMQLGVSVTSIFENNKDKHFAIHIFLDSYSNKNLENIKKTAEKYKQNIYIYIMDMKPFENFHIKTKRFSRVTYLRIIMPKILKAYTKKFLYMDADMICLGDITRLKNINLLNKPLAAVSDVQEAVIYRTNFLKMKSGKYFNDGIMWIDIENWERENITEKVFLYQGADPKNFLGQSQDLLNIVIDGNIVFADRKYNQPACEILPEDTIICHFMGRNKPWEMVLFECDNQWRHYLELSYWENISNIMPPKKTKYYHSYKHMAEVMLKRHKYIHMLEAYFWYAILKICKTIK